MNPLFKKFLPHLLVFAGFVAITFAYFSPMLGGKVLKQQDISQWRGSYEEIHKYMDAHHGEQTLWTNSMFGGMPSYQIGMSYYNNKVSWISQALTLGLASPAAQLILLLFCFYILMLTFGVNMWLSIVGSIAYAFSSYNFLNLQAGHETKVLAVAYAPLVLAGLNLAFKGNWLWAAVLTAIGLGLELLSNHLQITYYLLLICVVWAIAEFISAVKEGRLSPVIKGLGGALVGAIIAIGLNLTNLMLTEEYSKYTIREKSELTKPSVASDQTGGLNLSYATQWSNGTLEPLTVLMPNVVGGGGQGLISNKGNLADYLKASGQSPDLAKQMPAYHGDQPFTSGPIYFGAIVCFLFFLGMFIVKGSLKWALFIISFLAFFLSMGKNFMPLTEFFFNHFPLYNKFRAVTMTMVIAQICFPILALLSLKTILNKEVKKEDLMRYSIIALCITGGICFLFLAVPGMFLDFITEADTKSLIPQIFGAKPEGAGENVANYTRQVNGFLAALGDDRENLTRMSALRSLIFIGLSFGAIWLYIKDMLKKEYFIIATGLLVAVDLWSLDKKYLNNEEFQKKSKDGSADFPQSMADMQILQDKDPNYRVLNLTVSPFNDAHTSFYHKSVGGYHGAKFRRYQELREAYMDEPIGIAQQNRNIPPDNLMELLHQQGKTTIFDMMNAKYYIAFGQEGPTAIFNRYAFGNAWFTNHILWVKNADQEIDTLNGVDLHQTAVVDVRYEPILKQFKPTGTDSTSSIKLTSYEPNHLVYESNTTGDQFAVFSEIYYDKGWKATVDGKPAEYVRCNYVLRGMQVPNGKHKIEWVFDPETYNKGEMIAGTSSLLLYLLFFAALGLGIREYMKTNVPEKKTQKQK